MRTTITLESDAFAAAQAYAQARALKLGQAVSELILQSTAQKLALSYANRSYVRPSGSGAAGKIAEELKAEGYFGDDPARVVLVSGYTPGEPGTTNNIQVRVL